MTDFEDDPQAYELPVHNADEAALKQLANAAFFNNPELRLTLPSGRTIGSKEAQAFGSLYGPSAEEPDLPE